jgi:hypothetical protein
MPSVILQKSFFEKFDSVASVGHLFPRSFAQRLNGQLTRS